MTILFVISFVLLVYPIAIYPMLIVMLARLVGPRSGTTDSEQESNATLPSVSLLCVVRNGESLIREKIENSLALDYPEDRLEVVIASDGSTDRTVEIARSHASSSRIRVFEYAEHDGKISAINRTAPECEGEILVFSDTDALLDRQAIRELVRHFSASDIGGVCGRKYIAPSGDRNEVAQSSYVSYEDRIRLAESDLSSIASNEGKLYAIRKSLFQPLPEGVMDDLQMCLTVVAQRYRFVFAPEARARIPLPAKSRSHEIVRRRRIVGPSLFGLFAMRRLFNPFRYGLYAFMLFSHKVMRRMLPLFLILWMASALWLTFDDAWYLIVPAGPLAIYILLMILKTGWFKSIPGLRKLERLIDQMDYFILGNIGTFLGIVDFLLGRRCKKWDPVK